METQEATGREREEGRGKREREGGEGILLLHRGGSKGHER